MEDIIKQGEWDSSDNIVLRTGLNLQGFSHPS